jgi:hypothetical protein
VSLDPIIIIIIIVAIAIMILTASQHDAPVR